MDLFGVGLPEIIVILVVALIVVGPKRLPEVAAQVARTVKQLRGYATDVTSQMREELDELTREYESMRKELDEFRQVATQDIEQASKEIDSVSRQVDRSVRELPPIIESSAGPAPKAPSSSPPHEKPGRDDGA